MTPFNKLPGKVRNMFVEGFDEVLIFAIIFIIILLSGNETNSGDNMGLLPLLIIGAFLLLFWGTSRSDEITA